jgi:hypothetical protein
MVVPSESPRPWGTFYHAPPTRGTGESWQKVPPFVLGREDARPGEGRA